MTEVLERNQNGIAILWRCVDCSQPFNRGWGDQCNACRLAAKRHEELLFAIAAAQKPGGAMRILLTLLALAVLLAPLVCAGLLARQWNKIADREGE